MAATQGLLAKKMGMTRLFAEDGTVTPVTVLDASSNVVLGIKTEDSKDGYTPLMGAAFGGHDAVVRLLLDRGAEIDTLSSKHGGKHLTVSLNNCVS